MATLDFKFFSICQTALTLLPSTVSFPVLADMFLLSAISIFVAPAESEILSHFFRTVFGFKKSCCLSVLHALLHVLSKNSHRKGVVGNISSPFENAGTCGGLQLLQDNTVYKSSAYVPLRFQQSESVAADVCSTTPFRCSDTSPHMRHAGQTGSGFLKNRMSEKMG